MPGKYCNENTIKAYLLRSKDTLVEAKNVSGFLCYSDLISTSHLLQQFFSKPAHEKLLPELLPPPYQRPYTLVIEMSDILIHSEYDVSSQRSASPHYCYAYSEKLAGGIKRDQALINFLI